MIALWVFVATAVLCLISAALVFIAPFRRSTLRSEMAAFAGVAALFIADGVADNDAVRLLLQTSADNLGSPDWFGFGLVDAEGI